MIQLRAERAQTRLDVTQALPVRQLSECHAQKLIPTRESSDTVFAFVTLHGYSELMPRDKVHQLREDCSFNIHAIAIRWSKKNHLRMYNGVEIDHNQKTV
jgi:hypothetical protein